MSTLLIVAMYLIVVGGGLAVYATMLDSGVGGIVIGPFDVPGTDAGPTPLQRYYGVFGGLTLVIGVMCLVFGTASRFFNLLPTIITMSVLLGCMALVVVLSLMSGLEGDLRDKILAQKAHVRVARPDGMPFEDYLSLSDALAAGEGLAGASPYLEGEIMVRSGLNRQGAVLGGILPVRQTTVSNLPELVRTGDYEYLAHPERIPTLTRSRATTMRKRRGGCGTSTSNVKNGARNRGRSRRKRPTRLATKSPRLNGRIRPPRVVTRPTTTTADGRTPRKSWVVCAVSPGRPRMTVAVGTAAVGTAAVGTAAVGTAAVGT
ncbi:MAG: hypothetical protein JKY37_15140, partial [Nannocystaceae bacterium]|nr:hypothetical protein [Nannocystaceae bacterium]